MDMIVASSACISMALPNVSKDIQICYQLINLGWIKSLAALTQIIIIYEDMHEPTVSVQSGQIAIR